MLTVEQKEQIKHEEEYRAQIRKSTGKKKGKGFMKWGCITLLAVTVVPLFIVSVSPESYKDNETKKSITSDMDKDLIGSASIKDGQVVVTNKEESDWKGCRFNLNDSYSYPPFQGFMGADSKFIGTIESGGTYTVGIANFTKKGGERFNILATKPTDFSVTCLNGFGYWEW